MGLQKTILDFCLVQKFQEIPCFVSGLAVTCYISVLPSIDHTINTLTVFQDIG